MQPVGWIEGPPALVLAPEFTVALYVERLDIARSRGGITTPSLHNLRKEVSIPYPLP